MFGSEPVPFFSALLEEWPPRGISAGGLFAYKDLPLMIWLLVIVIPICIELAGWVVDATFASHILKERQVAQAEDFNKSRSLSNRGAVPDGHAGVPAGIQDRTGAGCFLSAS